MQVMQTALFVSEPISCRKPNIHHITRSKGSLGFRGEDITKAEIITCLEGNRVSRVDVVFATDAGRNTIIDFLRHFFRQLVVAAVGVWKIRNGGCVIRVEIRTYRLSDSERDLWACIDEKFHFSPKINMSEHRYLKKIQISTVIEGESLEIFFPPTPHIVKLRNKAEMVLLNIPYTHN